MNRCFRYSLPGGLALLIALTMTFTAQAQQGGEVGLQSQVLFGGQTPFTLITTMEIQGDFVAAGVGMRNVGSGSIGVSIPAGATINQSWIFWAIIWGGTAPTTNSGDVNGTTVTGNLIGVSGSPCWNGLEIAYYYADITNIVQTGANALSNFSSGLTNGAYPLGNTTLPLLEGATIVTTFTHPAWDFNTITIFGGTKTFAQQDITESFGSYTGWTGGNPADQTALNTFVMADGQATASGAGTKFNGVATSGPGTAIKTADAFNGADGLVNVSADYGLWDTHTLDVSSFFSNGASTAANVTAYSANDCITWGVQVLSVKTAINAFIDVKAGSCPNSVNVNSKGVLPVSIVGTSWFDVTDVDVSTVELNGVSPFANTVIEDSTMPYMAFATGCYDCNLGGSDGYDDLVLKFKMKDVVPSLSSTTNGDCVEVTVTGNLNDGTPFEGTDVIRIINNSSPKDGRGIGGFELALEQNAPNPVVTATSFSYTLPTAADVRLEIFNTLGQRVALVVDGSRAAGAHTATWDGLSSSGAPLTPGSYIYRLTAGEQVMSKMLVIAR